MTLYIDTKPELNEWNRTETNTYWWIETVFGNYSIDFFKHKFYLNWEILDEDGEVAYSITFEEPFNTLSEAKAAAQADYERRTADRFVMVQIPSTDQIENGSMDYAEGYEDAISDLKYSIKSALDRAKKGTHQ